MFYVLLRDEETRNEIIDRMKSNDILSVFHYLPLHRSPVGRQMGYKEGDFPVTESISRRLLRLPFYYELIQKEQDQVVNSIKNYFSMQ